MQRLISNNNAESISSQMNLKNNSQTDTSQIKMDKD